MAGNAPAPAPAPAPAQQEPQKPAGPPHPLENMQAMMNLVLITSGRYMKTVKQAPSESAKMQFQLKRAVSAGSERFHDSLDELENEIRHAQAVLRRDLARMRAQRKEREAAAKQKEAEKARLATESRNIPQPLKQEAAAPPAPAKPASPAPVKAEPAEPIKAEPVAEKEPTPKEPTPPADVAMDNTDSLGGMQESEFDFDARFGDSAMDTSGDAGNDQGDLNLDAGADLDFTLDEQPSDGLLRGLEDFAKGGADDTAGQNNASLDLDFNMGDMSDLNVTAPPPPQQQQPTTTMTATTTETTKQEDTAGQQASTTDELNLETMTTDNLDDLFDLDYQNPEATQFDDAFFGFDEN